MATVSAGTSTGVSASGSGVEFDQMSTLIIGDNKIELDVSFFSQLQQSRDPLSQLVHQAFEGINSINSANSAWWSGHSYGAASDLLSGIASGDDASLSKFADQLGLQSSQNQQLGQLIGQAKDDMHRIVLNAYDQIGQLGVSGTSSTGGLGPQAMSVVNNGRKAVDDLVVQLLGQIQNMRGANQDAATRFQNGKKDAKAGGESGASPGGQGDGVQLDQPQTKHNTDGSTTVTSKDKDGNVTYTTTHKDGSVDTTVATKDKDGNIVSKTTHGDGTSDTLIATKDKDGNIVSKTTQANGDKTASVYAPKDKKDTTTQANGVKTTTQTKPDGTQESTQEPPQGGTRETAGAGTGDRDGSSPPGDGDRSSREGDDGHGQQTYGDPSSQSNIVGGPGSGPGDSGFHGVDGGFHGGGGFHDGGGNQGGGPSNLTGNQGGRDWGGHESQQQQQDPSQQGNRNNPVLSTTTGNPEHTGAIGDNRAGPATPVSATGLQSGAPAPSTSPQSSSPTSSTSGGTNSTEARQTSSPSQSGAAGSPASPQGPLGQAANAAGPLGQAANAAGPLGNIANAAAQAASPLGNIANTAAGVGNNIANLAGAPGSLGQPPAPTPPPTPGLNPGPGSGFPGSDPKPAPGGAAPASFGGGGPAAPHQPPLQQAPPTNTPPPLPSSAGQTAPTAETPANPYGGAPTSPMGGAYPMSPAGAGQSAPTGGRHSRGGLGPWQADPNYTGPNTIDPLGNRHPNQEAIDTIVRLLRLVLDSDRIARENYPPGIRPAYAIAAHADPDEIVHYFFFTNQGRGWTPPGVVVPRATQLGWETVPPSGRGGLLGRSDPGVQALRHFEAMSQEYIASGKRYRLISIATSLEIRDQLNMAILGANDKIVGDVALAPEPRFVDPATSGGKAPESTTVLLHRLATVAPDAHRRISALLAEKADVSSLAMELAVDTVEASFAYDRPAFLEVVGALKRGEPITESMVAALREDVVAAINSAEIERSQQEAKPPADQKMVKYASDHTRISAGVALLALLEGDDDAVLDIAYEHYATNARPDKLSAFIDQLAPSSKPAL